MNMTNLTNILNTLNIKQITPTKALIFINILVFIFTFFVPQSSYWLGLNYFFTHGLYYQPLSSMFMHGDIFHLLFNMVMLFHFGSILERMLGAKMFLFFYIVGGILVGLISVLFMLWIYPASNMVGASGAICMLIAFYAYISQENLKTAILWIVLISLMPMLLNLNIAWWAHLIGGVLGFLIANVVVKKRQ